MYSKERKNFFARSTENKFLSFRAKGGENFLPFRAKRGENFLSFRAKRAKPFFYKNSKPIRRSKNVDSLLRFLHPRPLFRLRAKFSKKPVTKPDTRCRLAPRAEVALLFLVEEGRRSQKVCVVLFDFSGKFHNRSISLSFLRDRIQTIKKNI